MLKFAKSLLIITLVLLIYYGILFLICKPLSWPFFGRTLKKEPKHHQILGYVHFWKWQFHLIHQYACVSLLLIYGLDHVQVNFSWKWIVGKNLGWSANCWPSQSKFYPTIHFWLQFTCTWSWSLFLNYFSNFRALCTTWKISKYLLSYS